MGVVRGAEDVTGACRAVRRRPRRASGASGRPRPVDGSGGPRTARPASRPGPRSDPPFAFRHRNDGPNPPDVTRPILPASPPRAGVVVSASSCPAKEVRSRESVPGLGGADRELGPLRIRRARRGRHGHVRPSRAAQRADLRHLRRPARPAGGAAAAAGRAGAGADRRRPWLLLGDPLDAASAAAAGLANQVVDDDALPAATAALAGRLDAGPTLAYGATKALLSRELDMNLSGAVELEAVAQALMMTSADHAEFYAAFTEDREPRWTGR